VEQQSYIRVRNSQINYYKEVALYYQSGADAYCLYKPPGTNLAEMRISRKRHPGLYIQEKDRLTAITEIQKEFSRHLADSIETGNVLNVKATLCDLVEDRSTAGNH
jgi:hypothetical protein